MDISKRLFQLRKSHKATLRAVSKQCGCTFQYLQKIEKGIISRPKIDLLYKLAAFYQFPSDTLIVEAGKIPEDVYWKIVRNPEIISIVRAIKIGGAA